MGVIRWNRLSSAEALFGLAGVGLGAWLSLEWSILGFVSLAGGGWALALFLRSRSRWMVLAAAIVAFGAIVAIRAGIRIGTIESEWPRLEEELIERTSEQLGQELREAVLIARDLAERDVSLPADREKAFGVLEGAVAATALETGIVIYDRDGRPWVWAGRIRVAPLGARGDLDARITSSYSVLEAWGGGDGSLAVSQVLLAADSSIPVDGATMAGVFARKTGAGLEFFAPRRAPLASDVFDYCNPACGAAAVEPDTLFAVRPVLPRQGELRLAASRRSGTLISWLLIAAAACALIGASIFLKRFALIAIAGLLILTPAGSYLGMGELFSAGTFFWGALGIFSSSAGALLVTAALVVVVSVGVRGLAVTRKAVAVLASVALIAAAPYVLQRAARGITPPASGVDVATWISWEVTMAVASAAFLFPALALMRSDRDAPAWMAWVASIWALMVAALGLITWMPGSAWPEWYTFLWFPSLLLAIQSAPRRRSVVAVAMVAGSASALLTWGAVVEGRLVLARRDAELLTEPSPLLTLSLLDNFGSEIANGELPTTAADLYQRWRDSPLGREGYPARLVAWDRNGREIATFSTAVLPVSDSVMRRQAVAAAARPPGEIVLDELVLEEPGAYRVLAVPFPDGVVTALVGPPSRLIPPSLTAQYLSPPPATDAPYRIYMSEGVRESEEGFTWTRDGWLVRGTARLPNAEGARHLHVDVSLEGFGPLAVRGLLLVVVDAVAIGMLFMTGAFLFGGLRLRGGDLPEYLRPSSYRARLALALSIFFVVPTLGFAGWTVTRLGIEVDRSRDLLVRRQLREAAALLESRTEKGIESGTLSDVARDVGADVLLYSNGVMQQTSNPLLQQLGLFDLFLPVPVFRELILSDEVELVQRSRSGGTPDRIGYRSLGSRNGVERVLALPGVIPDADLAPGERDLVYLILLATLVGLGGSVGLANLAARSLSRPVQMLRSAAHAVGRGEEVGPFEESAPPEFAPVVSAFERMERDVREHQQALESTLRYTSAVLRNVATGIVVLDGDLCVTSFNPRAEVLLGHAVREGDPVRECGGAQWRDVWDWVRQFSNSGESVDSREFTVGNMRVQSKAAALEMGGCVVALDDATELARAERVLAWGEMARQVAHEIKNPLTPIRLGVQHLRRAWDGRGEGFEEVLDRTVTTILAEIERLDAIARAFSRFGAPAEHAGPIERVDLAAVVRETERLYSVAGDAEVSVEGETGIFGLANPGELKEVLVNLIENARNAGARRVVLRVVGGDGEARIVAADDGGGIPAEVLPRIFEPHFSTTTSGTGLGLAICRRLVESWNGTIEAESTVGRGTTITITIPA